MPLRVPPGRMGRLWLRDRLAVADRASDLLEQKRRALRTEVDRLERLAAETRERWTSAADDARRWLDRATELGGDRQLELAATRIAEPAAARVVWRTTMGLAYPSEAGCTSAPPADAAAFGTTSALAFALEAHRAALAAAVEHAAAQRALDLVTLEIALTTQRLRAIEKRWVPRLEETLHVVEERLAEREREDVIRARRAAERRAARAADRRRSAA